MEITWPINLYFVFKWCSIMFFTHAQAIQNATRYKDLSEASSGIGPKKTKGLKGAFIKDVPAQGKEVTTMGTYGDTVTYILLRGKLDFTELTNFTEVASCKLTCSNGAAG